MEYQGRTMPTAKMPEKGPLFHRTGERVVKKTYSMRPEAINRLRELSFKQNRPQSEILCELILAEKV